MIFDVICAIILVLFIVIGFKRGFVRSVCNLLSFVLSVMVAFLCYDKISEWVASSSVGAFVTEKISGSVNMPGMDLTTMPELVRVPLETSVQATSDAVNTLSRNFSAVVIGIISVIITIIIVKIGIKIIFKLFDIIAKIPVLKQCNGILGGVLGAVSGCLWICIIAVVVTYLSVMPKATLLKDISEGSYVIETVSNNEFIVTLIPTIK